MSTRIKKRIDYQKLHNSGERVSKHNQSDETSNDQASGHSLSDSNQSNMDEYVIEFNTITADIDDFLDENDIKEFDDHFESVDIIIDKVEQLRSKYRFLHEKLKSFDEYDEKYGKQLEIRLATIKQYIKDAKTWKKSVKAKEVSKQAEKEYLISRSIDFIVDDIHRGIREVEMETIMAVSTTSNDEITRRDKDLPNLRRRMETISDKIKSLMKQPTDEKTLKDSKTYPFLDIF